MTKGTGIEVGCNSRPSYQNQPTHFEINRYIKLYKAPFSEEIMTAVTPSHIIIPTLNYDGTTDPEDHLAAFRIRMDLYNCSEAISCKIFPTTFTGSALKWYKNYSGPVIYSWDQFSFEFIKQFFAFRDSTMDVHQLSNIKQKPRETLNKYIRRFSIESSKVKNITDREKLAIARVGLKEFTPFWKYLYLNGCEDLMNFYSRAMEFISLDKARHKRKRRQRKMRREY